MTADHRPGLRQLAVGTANRVSTALAPIEEISIAEPSSPRKCWADEEQGRGHRHEAAGDQTTFSLPADVVELDARATP